VLAGGNSLAFDDHVLTYAETSHPGVDRCQLWEFHNEPTDMPGYIADWNLKIPYLRAHHPQAKFIGPVIMAPFLSQMQAFLTGVKASGVLPDAISYHDYPCYSGTDYTLAQAASCDSRIQSGYTANILRIKGMVQATLGVNLPVGITEWNVSPNFVKLVNGQLPLTVDPNYQPHFIQEIYAAMKAGGLDFASEFDAMSGAGGGSAGSLDLITSNGTSRPWISTYTAEISAARAGAPLPGPSTIPSARSSASAAARAQATARESGSLATLPVAPAKISSRPAPTSSGILSLPRQAIGGLLYDLPARWAGIALQLRVALLAVCGCLLAVTALGVRSRILRGRTQRIAVAPTAVAGTPMPASEASNSAFSVRSQRRSRSDRPKWP
jgi:hypothetical protein